MTQRRSRGRALFTGVVVLQAALLLANAIMVPAAVMAQDPSAPESAAVRRGGPGAVARTHA